VISTLVDHLQGVYLHHMDAKKLWDALEADYGGTDAGAELYIMEQYHNYKMTDGKSVVEQAHEIQCMAKELEHLKINLPDKFVAGGIIAKLPPSWRDFATTLKHKRMEISVSDLIASLDVEEKVWAKDGRSKATEDQTGPTWCKSLTAKARARERRPSHSLPLLSRKRNLRKVKAILCVDLPIIWQRSAHTANEGSLHLSRRLRTRSPWVEWKPVGIILCLWFFQYFNLLVGGLILVQMFMCILMLPCFLLTRPLMIIS
jgi:hypothetical protein